MHLWLGIGIPRSILNNSSFYFHPFVFLIFVSKKWKKFFLRGIFFFLDLSQYGRGVKKIQNFFANFRTKGSFQKKCTETEVIPKTIFLKNPKSRGIDGFSGLPVTFFPMHFFEIFLQIWNQHKSLGFFYSLLWEQISVVLLVNF